jgi:hypothetical protein
MLLFRSEEHVERWGERRRIPTGATLTPQQGWRLADAWFEDRLSFDWRRKTPEEARAIFDGIGLTDPFWDLRPQVSPPGAPDTSEA